MEPSTADVMVLPNPRIMVAEPGLPRSGAAPGSVVIPEDWTGTEDTMSDENGSPRVRLAAVTEVDA